MVNVKLRTEFNLQIYTKIHIIHQTRPFWLLISELEITVPNAMTKAITPTRDQRTIKAESTVNPKGGSITKPRETSPEVFAQHVIQVVVTALRDTDFGDRHGQSGYGKAGSAYLVEF